MIFYSQNTIRDDSKFKTRSLTLDFNHIKEQSYNPTLSFAIQVLSCGVKGLQNNGQFLQKRRPSYFGTFTVILCGPNFAVS